MPDGTTQVATSIYEMGKWVIVFLLGLVGFNLKKLSEKVDEHDAQHATRKELVECSKNVNDSIEKLGDRIIASHTALSDRIDKLMDK